jgi:hypothetical protein
MEISRYLFESPYSSQVQIGRKDTSVSDQKNSQSLVDTSNQTATKAQSFESSQTKEVKPAVDSKNSLDVYA